VIIPRLLTVSKKKGDDKDDDKDSENAKLKSGLANSTMLIEKPNVKWADVAGLQVCYFLLFVILCECLYSCFVDFYLFFFFLTMRGIFFPPLTLIYYCSCFDELLLCCMILE
jgi:hypothetical protein